MHRMTFVLSLIVIADGCSSASIPTPGSLDARQVLRRASLDVRGRPPTNAELDDAEAHPENIDARIDRYLDDNDAFGRSVRDLFARAFRTRFEDYYSPGADYGEDAEFQTSIAEEPLKLIEDIAVSNRAFTDLVTTSD